MSDDNQYLPRTMLVQCNRKHSIDDKNEKKNEWSSAVNNLELRENDKISVHSSYINSVGSGDLIEWNKDGDNQDDKVRILMSYYVNNHALNQLREGYNFNNTQGKKYEDVNNKPLQLYRFQKLSERVKYSPSDPNSGVDSYYKPIEDKFLPGQFYKTCRIVNSSYTLENCSLTINPSTTGANHPVLTSTSKPIIQLLHPTRAYYIRFFNIVGQTWTSHQFSGVHSIRRNAFQNPSVVWLEYEMFKLNWFSTDAFPTTEITITCDIEVHSVPNRFYNELNGGRIQTFNFDPEQANADKVIFQEGQEVDNYFISMETFIQANDYIYKKGSGTIVKSFDLKPDDFRYYFSTTLKSTTVISDTDTEAIIEGDLTTLNYSIGQSMFIAMSGLYTPDSKEYMLGWVKSVNATDGETTIGLNRAPVGVPLYGGHVPAVHTEFDDIEIWNPLTISKEKLHYYVELTVNLPLEGDNLIIETSEMANLLAGGGGAPDYYDFPVLESIITNKGPNDLPVETEFYKACPNHFVVYPDESGCKDWVIHYRHKAFDLSNQNFSSPSDISNELTLQTHSITNLYDSEGNEIVNSQGKFPVNEFSFPVYTPSHDTEGNLIEEPTTNQTTWQPLTGDKTIIKGAFPDMAKFPEGSFCLIGYIEDIPNIGDSRYFIYFRTRETYHNIGNMIATDGRGEKSRVYKDYIIPKTATPTKAQIETYMNDDANDLIAGFPIKIYEKGSQEVLCSQLVGSNNITIQYDQNLSRFTIEYLHQPYTNTYSNVNGQDIGGDPSILQLFPAVSYKDHLTRLGGVNIERWAIDTIQPGQYQINDSYIHPLDPDYYEPIGLRFWNKLGFSKTFMNANRGWNNVHVPLGTTDARVDISTNLIIQNKPPEEEPRYWDVGLFDTIDKNGVFQAKSKYGSYGGMYLNNTSRGYGMPNSTSVPAEYEISNFDADHEYGDRANYLSNGSENRLLSIYNPDRQRHTYSTIKAESNQLKADSEPQKSISPYYFILSDIVDSSEGYISTNQRLPIVGLSNKVYTSLDFFTTQENPQSFVVRHPRTVSKISIRILDSNLEVPNNLGDNSSVIFMIQRNSENPNPILPNIFQQQQQMFQILTELYNKEREKNNKKALPEAEVISEFWDELLDEDN